MVDEILDTIAADGGCDLVSTLAFPLPFQVISELLGMPTDEREQLRAWSQAITLTLEPLITAEERQAATEASGHMREFVEAVIAERRKAPARTTCCPGSSRPRRRATGCPREELVRGAAALRRRPRDDGEPDRQRHAACSCGIPTCSHASEPIPPLDATAVDELLRYGRSGAAHRACGARAGRLRRRLRREGRAW